MTVAELCLDCRNLHGEGVHWNARDGRVWWTDIHGRQLWWFDPASGRSGALAMVERVACFAPRAEGGFLVAFADGLALLDPESGALERLHDFEPNDPATRLNDGRTDRQGRFVVGGMNEATGEPTSRVILIDGERRVRTLFEGVACANATCFSPDGCTMYFADSPTRTLLAFAYDPETGEIGERRVLADLADRRGVPDGACVDAQGCVFVAMWEGGCVLRIAPDGRVLQEIAVPVAKPTSCAFGGADLASLFITTSRLMSTAEEIAAEPLSGSLFVVRPGVAGLGDAPFMG